MFRHIGCHEVRQMTGRVKLSREKGRTPPRVEVLCGLPLMTVTLHTAEDVRPGTQKRRLSRMEQTLRRASVRRVIFPADFPYREQFRHFKAVEPLEFYRAVADVLALGWLEVHGIDACRGRVALAGTRLSPDMEYAARRLCRMVKSIRIDVPGEEGALFAAELQQNCGVPVLPAGAVVDLTVEFSPTGGNGQLRLWGEQPFFDGLRLTAEGVEPPDELAESMLTLLWEQGKIRREQLRVGSNEKKEK